MGAYAYNGVANVGQDPGPAEQVPTGANRVTLSIQDVIDMTDGDNHLTIIGDQGDVVNLTGLGANNNWHVVGSGAGFTTYAWHDGSHDAVVEISNQMTIQVG